MPGLSALVLAATIAAPPTIPAAPSTPAPAVVPRLERPIPALGLITGGVISMAIGHSIGRRAELEHTQARFDVDLSLDPTGGVLLVRAQF